MYPINRFFIALALLFFVQNNCVTAVERAASCIKIEHGDITRSSCQAIVNAANEQLLGGAGVCGAIFKAAGWKDLQQACNKHVTLDHGIKCPVGQARITNSFNLKSRGIQYVIHAVGPDCRVITNIKEQDMLLESAYKQSLMLADQYGIKSIAFPFISSAIYAFPKQRACDIALKTVSEYMRNNNTTQIERVEFVLFSKEDYDLFSTTLKKMR